MNEFYPGINDLLTWCNENGERGELLKKEWDTGEDKNLGMVGGLTWNLPMEGYKYNASNVKCDWKCSECGNEFKMTPRSRTIDGQGCSICGHKRAALKRHEDALKENNLKKWCEENGLLGKKLLEEWDTEKNREELGIGMEDVTAGSGEYVYWKCPKCGESNLHTIYHRIISLSSCKCCRKSGTSFPEQFIFRSLKQIYSDTENRVKLFENVEYDIYIPSENFCIEYNGEYWHKSKIERDKLKKHLCEENNVRFLQISGCSKNEPLEFSKGVIKYGISCTQHQSQLKEVIEYIVKMLGHQVQEIDFDKALDEVFQFMGQEVENNIAEKYPELVKEWDIEKNHNKKPEYFTRGSGEMIKWTCFHCGKEWEVSIKSRVTFQSGCSKCGYNIFDGKIHPMARNKPKVSLQLGRYSL